MSSSKPGTPSKGAVKPGASTPKVASPAGRTVNAGMSPSARKVQSVLEPLLEDEEDLADYESGDGIWPENEVELRTPRMSENGSEAAEEPAAAEQSEAEPVAQVEATPEATPVPEEEVVQQQEVAEKEAVIPGQEEEEPLKKLRSPPPPPGTPSKKRQPGDIDLMPTCSPSARGKRVPVPGAGPGPSVPVASDMFRQFVETDHRNLARIVRGTFTPVTPTVYMSNDMLYGKKTSDIIGDFKLHEEPTVMIRESDLAVYDVQRKVRDNTVLEMFDNITVRWCERS